MKIFQRTFDNATTDFDRSHPMYVKEIYDDIFSYKPIHSNSHVLEIDMGTGKAAQPILETQCHFVGIETGEHLAGLAKKRFQNMQTFPYIIRRYKTMLVLMNHLILSMLLLHFTGFRKNMDTGESMSC